MKSHYARIAVAIIPLLLVNSIAVFGQLAFIRTHMHWPLTGDIMFATALESVAVYLAYHAHVTLIANDSAMRLRLASYAFGLLIGTLNYSHYAHGWRPGFQAVAVGLLSASSPWLWGIHSRRQSRDALMAAGLIEPHAVRLGSTRWMFHPYRCLIVLSRAAWAGEQDVNRAMALVPRWFEQPDGMCIDGKEHEPYNVKAGTQVTKCRKCRRSVRVESGPSLQVA